MQCFTCRLVLGFDSVGGLFGFLFWGSSLSANVHCTPRRRELSKTVARAWILREALSVLAAHVMGRTCRSE